MQRLVEFVQPYRVHIRLAYYPPCQSKYNLSERCWGILETHGNGAVLASMEAGLQLARPMTGKGPQPVVALVTTPYQTGVKLTAEAMDLGEAQIKRLPLLGKWFVDIGLAPLSLWAS